MQVKRAAMQMMKNDDAGETGRQCRRKRTTMQVMRNDEVDVVDIVADVVEVIAAHVAVCAARSTAVRDPNSSDAFWVAVAMSVRRGYFAG